MCIIIIKKKSGKLDPVIIAKSLCLNPHGLGIQLLDTGEVLHTMDIAEAKSWLETERPFIAHARYATRGEESLDNVHPIKVNEYNHLYHNGTVNTPKDWPETKSDTRFIAEILRKTPWQSWTDILSMSDSRFAYSRISKTGKVYINKTGKWHHEKDVLYSKDNVLGSTHLVAVYGTLREGFGNNRLLRTATYLGIGGTVLPYKMVCNGIPFVLPDVDHEAGNSLTVEVYAVDAKTLAGLDRLESHPTWYERSICDVKLDNGLVLSPQLYFCNKVDDTPPYYTDYSSYRNQPNSLSRDSIFDEDPSDSIWDPIENKWFNMLTNEYIDTGQKTLF